MPRTGSAAAGRLVSTVLAGALAVAGCSGTVQASYRPPPPPAPSPIAAPAPATPPPDPTTAPALNCGPDKVAVRVGDVQSDATSRAVPLLITGNGPVPCGVANPVRITLLDEAGQALDIQLQNAELPDGRTPVDSFTADRGVMLWLQWRTAPSTDADPATDCVDGQSLLLKLTKAAPAIPVPAAVQACDGGTVYVSPAEANLG